MLYVEKEKERAQTKGADKGAELQSNVTRNLSLPIIQTVSPAFEPCTGN